MVQGLDYESRVTFLLEEIKFLLENAQRDKKEELRKAIQDHLTVSKMKTFDDVVSLFDERLKLILGELYEQAVERDQAPSAQHVKYKLLGEYYLSVECEFEGYGVEIKTLEKNDTVSLHTIHIRYGCYQITERIVDDLIYNAFSDVVEKDWGWEMGVVR